MRIFLTAALAAIVLSNPVLSDPVLADSWQDTLEAAKGQTVYLNAWGGNPQTNAFIVWFGQ